MWVVQVVEDDGEVSRDEFLAWYMAKGCYYLDKPVFSDLGLEVPSMAKRKELFLQIDDDNSGELSFLEVREAVEQIWPKLPESECVRAFKTAVRRNAVVLPFLVCSTF